MASGGFGQEGGQKPRAHFPAFVIWPIPYLFRKYARRHISEKLTFLTGKRFSQYWSRTGTGKKQSAVHDRDRFREIIKMIEDEGIDLSLRKPPLPPAIGRAIVDKCADGKWHPVE